MEPCFLLAGENHAVDLQHAHDGGWLKESVTGVDGDFVATLVDESVGNDDLADRQGRIESAGDADHPDSLRGELIDCPFHRSASPDRANAKLDDGDHALADVRDLQAIVFVATSTATDSFRDGAEFGDECRRDERIDFHRLLSPINREVASSRVN